MRRIIKNKVFELSCNATLHIFICCYKIYRLVRGILQRGVAQVVECLLREQEAVGSSPATPTKFSNVSEIIGV